MTMPRVIGHQTPRQKKASPNLALSARAATKQGRDIITFLVDVLRSEHEITSDRLKAADLLLNRGWGRAPIEIHVEVEETVTLKTYSLDDLLSMRKAMNQLEESREVIEATIVQEDGGDADEG
jgi:hypothetical protein